MKITLYPDKIAELGRSQEMADGMLKLALQVKSRVRAPGHLKVFAWASKGRTAKTAYSQVVMRGEGALAVEFGTRRSRPLAPLRTALRSIQ